MTLIECLGDNTSFRLSEASIKQYSKEPINASKMFNFNMKSKLLEDENDHNEVPKTDKDMLNLEDILDHFKNIDLSGANLCTSCLRWKFERSHHCRQCGKCILKMDHHCPWLANCVGFRNYKYFCFIYIANIGLFVFLFWLFVSNWKLVFSGQTIIEQSDRDRFPSSKTLNVYDLGSYRNFKAVFGENFLTWFLPIYPNYKGLGIIFETNESAVSKRR